MEYACAKCVTYIVGQFKMADGRRLGSVYYNGRKRYDFSRLRAKDKSKMRKQTSRTREVQSHLSSDSDDGGLDVCTDFAVEPDDTNVQEPMLQPQRSYDPPHSIQGSSSSVLDEYVLLLCRYEAVTIIDFKTFTLPEFNSGQHKLQEKSYVFIERKAYSFEGGDICWLYSCSCNSRRSLLLKSLAPQLHLGASNCIVFLGDDCSHIKALSVIVTELDNVFDITPDVLLITAAEDHNYSAPVKVVKLHGSSTLVCVLEPNPAIVLCEHGFSCLSCNRGRAGACDHIKFVEYLKENIHEAPDDVAELLITAAFPSQSPVSSVNRSISHPTSKLPIPFELTGSLQDVFADTPENIFPVCRNTGALQLIPSLPAVGSLFEKCPLCHSSWSSEDPLVHCWIESTVTLYARKRVYKCIVYYRPCSSPSCGSRYQYDGRDSALLFMGKFAVSYEVLRDFMFHFLEGRCSMYTYYNVWALALKDAHVQHFQSNFSYNMWRSSWYGFLKLLDIDYTAGFCCSTCGTHALDIIICDGTSLAFRKELCTLFQSPASSQSDPQEYFAGR